MRILFPGSGAKKSELVAVTPAPFAEQEMHSQAKPLTPRERAIKRVRLQSGYLPATRRKPANPSDQRFPNVNELTHLLLLLCHQTKDIIPSIRLADRMMPRRRGIIQLLVGGKMDSLQARGRGSVTTAHSVQVFGVSLSR